MVNNINRYFKIYLSFIKNSLSVDVEYRTAFIFKNIASLCWIVASFFAINIIFSQATLVGGWQKWWIILLYISFSISIDFFNLFLIPNFMRFSGLIRNGDLDRMLTKPANSRFMVSLVSDSLDTSVLLRLIVGFVLLIKYLPIGTSMFALFSYFGFLILGNLAVYSVIFMLHTLNIWLVKVDNMTIFSQTAFESGRLPLDSWPKIIQFFLISVFPIGIASSFAVQALLGRSTVYHLVIAVTVSIGLFILSQKFWNFALRHYSSASS